MFNANLIFFPLFRYKYKIIESILSLKMDSSDTNAELYKSFVQLHRAQLKSNAIPEIYWSSLFTKLKNEVNFSKIILFGIFNLGF